MEGRDPGPRLDAARATKVDAGRSAPIPSLAVAIPFARVLREGGIVAPFVGPREIERRRGRAYKARLGANECLFGVSPAALRVAAARAAQTALYSDPTHAELRAAIGAAHGIDRRRVTVAEGIEGLLGLLTRAFLDPGDVAVTSRGGYPSFDYYVLGCGARVEARPYLESCRNDLPGLLDLVRRSRAKLLYLANPDNPTGTHAGVEEIRALRAGLPEGCVLLLDEAYVDLADPSDVLPMGEISPNLVRLRTFSKIYGLAGARVGYAIADEDLLAPIEQIRQHFGVSLLAQEMALAAFEDRAFVERVLTLTEEGRRDYASLAERAGAAVIAGSANFVAFDFHDAERARAVTEWLEAHDVFVRRVPVPPLDRLVRITVGPAEAPAYLSEVFMGGTALKWLVPLRRADRGRAPRRCCVWRTSMSVSSR